MKENRNDYYQRLIQMLEELDYQKNDKETIEEVIKHIANELKQYSDDIK